MSTRIIPLLFVSAQFIGATTMPTLPSLLMRVGSHEATIVLGPPGGTPSVTGAAYSADEVLEYTTTLADWTHRTQGSVIGHLFRDAHGRIRAEKAWKAAPIWTTEIFDTVEGFAYLLDDQQKIATGWPCNRLNHSRSQPMSVA
jgi:hypothetical protein